MTGPIPAAAPAAPAEPEPPASPKVAALEPASQPPASPQEATLVTAVQNEVFTLCGRSYKLTRMSPLLGNGISLHVQGEFAKPIQVMKAEPTTLLDDCEVTLIDMGEGPAPIVQLKYRALRAAN